MTRILPGQRVEHVILGYRGYVQSVESGNPRMVNIRTDDGERRRATEAALKVLGTDMTSATHRSRGVVA